MDRTQVKLKLTSNPEVLSALNRVGALKTDTKGRYLAIQFDAFEYRFYPDMEIVVPSAVAEGLYRGSGVLIGDAMSGTQQPGLEVVEKWELGEQEPSKKVSKTVCSVCGEDQKTVKALVTHMAVHADEEDEVEEEK